MKYILRKLYMLKMCEKKSTENISLKQIINR